MRGPVRGAGQEDVAGLRGGRVHRLRRHHGRALQVDPIKPTVKAPGTKRLKLEYEELPSNFALKFNFAPLHHGVEAVLVVQ